MLQIRSGQPALVLAPMEGVTDFPMRALMSERGGFSYCVADFMRVSQDIPSVRAVIRHMPELETASRTAAGTPVQVQLLGGDPERLGETARRACLGGALAVDLNFGCPAPTVNRHDGGATLLKHPQRIRDIVTAVRKAVPAHIPVSAKLRLGWDSVDPIHENAEMAAQGGASWITIHGRTKTQGYAPPAYWQPIGEVRARLKIPVVANGEIWTVDDLKRCQDETQCEHFMIGRSALADPALPLKIARELKSADVSIETIESFKWRAIFERFHVHCMAYSNNPNYSLCRLKQWLSMANARRNKPWVEPIRRANSLAELFSLLGDR